MKYVVEWQMGGEITIDTDETDWETDELETAVGNAMTSAGEKVNDAFEEEFEDCEVDGNGTAEFQIRRTR